MTRVLLKNEEENMEMWVELPLKDGEYRNILDKFNVECDDDLKTEDIQSDIFYLNPDWDGTLLDRYLGDIDDFVKYFESVDKHTQNVLNAILDKTFYPYLADTKYTIEKCFTFPDCHNTEDLGRYLYNKYVHSPEMFEDTFDYQDWEDEDMFDIGASFEDWLVDNRECGGIVEINNEVIYAPYYP